MVLIQLLLPQAANGEALDEPFRQTRIELVEKFKGITAYQRAPARGAWRSPEGDIERDDVVMVEVVAEHFDRGWWRHYQQVLEDRFDQREIHVRAISIQTP